MEDKNTGELKILVNGELLQISHCARVIITIIEGIESNNLKSKFQPNRLSAIVNPITVRVGNSKKELFSYSKSGLEYFFLPNGHSKNVVDAARNHYTVIEKELKNLMNNYHGTPTQYFP